MMDLKVLGFLFYIFTIVAGQINLNVKFVIFEEVPNGTLVGNIANESRIQASANMSVEEFETLRYNFLDQTPMQNLFSIDERNGNLHTLVVIDRELVCGLTELCELEFDIAVHSSLNFIVVSVKIELKDKNDHLPIFPSKIINLSIIESSNNGSTLTIDEATDEDSSIINNIQSYEIVPGNGTFGLNVSKKQDGGFNLKLVLHQQLDRESRDSYVYHVIAKDGGNPPNMGSVEVNIKITDYNDNSPVFDQLSYTGQVKEGAEFGTPVLQLIAFDRDIGNNGKVIYRFSSRQSDADVTSLFSINETSGVLFVTGNLIYESGKSYKIFIEASDQGEQPQVAQTTAVVAVLDAGNNKPVVKINFLAQANVLIVNNVSTVNVSESSSTNTVIAHVTVEDTDSGQNGYVKCNLSDEAFGIKELNSGKGFIVSVRTQLNREQKNLHNVIVKCYDHGTPRLTSTILFKVTVTDTNDNAPKFLQNTYFASISENNVIGEIVKQVSAEDLDLGRNAEVMYYLDTDSGGKFAINSNTGVITANTIFDREMALRHIFRVLAVDSGNPPMTGTTTVILTVDDKNDNVPQFDVPSFQFFVMENLPVEASVGTLNAKDLDDGDNKKISFSVSMDFRSKVPFIVYSNGSIKTTTRLDRETQSKYEFKITAADNGTPSLRSTADVVVYVVDDNDNSPIFTFPNNKNKTETVLSNIAIGSVIAKVDAYDRDEEGPNSYLMFSIIQGNEQDIFSIGKSSGNIYIKRNYPFVNDQEFTLIISAVDMGQIPRETKQDMKVIMQYTNTTAVAQLASENGTRNVVISIVVVALTMIISAAMITVICLLRRKDKNRMMKEEPTQFSAVAPGSQILEKPKSFPAEQQIQSPQKKKKEVSFSLDDDIDFMTTNEFNNSINSVFTDSINEVHQGQSQKSNVQLKTLHLHQVHLKSHLDGENKKNSQHPSQFDDISDTSVETTNSDSGKGGSDVDIPNSTLQDATGPFNYFDNRSRPAVSSSFLSSSLVTKFSQPRTKNKHEKSRKDNPKSSSNNMYPETLDSKTNSGGHNSASLSKARHYENLHVVESDCENENSGKTEENWVPSYV